MNIAQPAQAARSSEAHLSFLQSIFGEKKERAAWAPLYRAIVERARDPFWYREGGVPDTLDGRFDMVAALTALVLIRLEALGEAGRGPGVLLTELFVEDMDSSLRQIGIGDYVVGKHVGRMVSALGGRLAAFRAGDFAAAARRNLFHDSPPSEEAAALVAGRLEQFAAALDALGLDSLAEGALP